MSDAIMTDGYLSIRKDWFEKTKTKALKAAKENGGEEDLFDWPELKIKIDEQYVTTEGKLRCVFVNEDNDEQTNVYFSVELPLDPETMADIMQHAIKQYNKVKSAFETLK